MGPHLSANFKSQNKNNNKQGLVYELIEQSQIQNELVKLRKDLDSSNLQKIPLNLDYTEKYKDVYKLYIDNMNKKQNDE